MRRSHKLVRGELIRRRRRSVRAVLVDLHFLRPDRLGVGAGEHRLDHEVDAADEVLIGRKGHRPRRAAVHFAGEAVGFFRHSFGALVVGPGGDEARREGWSYGESALNWRFAP